MNDTTFQGDGKVVNVPVIVGAKPKSITNADRIRSMTDEELAEWLCDIAGWLPMYEGKMHPILDWLKEEVTK